MLWQGAADHQMGARLQNNAAHAEHIPLPKLQANGGWNQAAYRLGER